MGRRRTRVFLLFIFTTAVLCFFAAIPALKIAFKVDDGGTVDAHYHINDFVEYNEAEHITEYNEPERTSPSSERRPHLAWLMTYPNSGTTYTLSLMESVTNTSMASNYMQDRKVLPRPTVNVFEDQPEGPFWRGPIVNRPLPNTTVLVKTHCIHSGGPGKATTMSVDSFIEGCRKTTNGYYDGVSKAVHLVRNPFDNLISAFHHFLQGPDTAQNFQENCRKGNLRKWPEKFENTSFTKEDLELIWNTPCHNKVIFYTMWHNRAFELPARLGIESLLIYYEDYENDLQGTTQRLLDFIDLPFCGELLPFAARHDYGDYFSTTDRQNIQTLVKKLATNETWQAVRRYFE